MDSLPNPSDSAGSHAPGGTELAPAVTAPDSAMRWQFARSGGPGGQNVNKLNTKAELWIPLNAISGMNDRAIRRLVALAGKRITAAGEIHISADDARTQEANRSAVLERLRDLLVAALHEPKPRRRTAPSRAARRKRLESKRRRSEIKASRRSTAE